MPWNIIALPAILCFAYGFWKGLSASKSLLAKVRPPGAAVPGPTPPISPFQ
jgi:hypothetical protein